MSAATRPPILGKISLKHGTVDSGSIHRVIEAWLPLTFAVNSLVRCMGKPDFYPFVLSPQAVTKIGFIHELVHPNHQT